MEAKSKTLDQQMRMNPTPMFPLGCARAHRSLDERTQENLECA